MVPGRSSVIGAGSQFRTSETAGGPARGIYLRLFYALWPDEALRDHLAAGVSGQARQAGGRPVPPGNYHLTLAFLGKVPGADLGPLIQLGGQVRGAPVKLVFDRLDYWPRPRVLVALASQAPPAGLALVEELWARLEALGFQRETRPWQPHLTLARRVSSRPPPTLALAPSDSRGLRAEFRTLALVESESAPRGARYRPIADWPLAG